MTMEIEANPDHFHRIGYLPLLVDVRRKLAQMIGANVDECVLVANASMGINTILRNFDWEEGDTIVACKHFTTRLARGLTAIRASQYNLRFRFEDGTEPQRRSTTPYGIPVCSTVPHYALGDRFPVPGPSSCTSEKGGQEDCRCDRQHRV